MKKLLRILNTITLISTASTSVVACVTKKEEPAPPAQKINLDSLQDNASVTLKKTNKTVNDYQKALITELQKQVAFSSLQLTDVDITKDDGTALQDNDIKTDDISTKVKAKTASLNFTGEKIITVKTNIVQVNLNDLQDSANMILQKTNKTVNDYQKALITELQKQVAFSSLQLTDVNITKDDGTALQNNDIKTDNINTKIKAKTASPNFTGEKIITVKTTVIDKTEVAKFPAEVESLAFKNNDLYAGCKSGFIYKIDVSAPTPTEVEIINLGIWIETLVFKDNDLYAGCNDMNIYKIDVSASIPTKTKVIDLPASVESLAFKDNDLYAGCNDNKIYKIDVSAPIPTKTEIIDLLNKVSTLVFKDNDLYVGCADKHIYKINISSSPATKIEVVNLSTWIESLVFNGNNLYAGCKDQKIYKIFESI